MFIKCRQVKLEYLSDLLPERTVSSVFISLAERAIRWFMKFKFGEYAIKADQRRAQWLTTMQQAATGHRMTIM
jgi:hypothetical protein